MKKNKLYILVIGLLICLALIVSIAKIAVSAEDEIPSSVDTGVVETESLPADEETVTDDENSAVGDMPAEAPALTTEQVLDWIFENYEEITVILAVIAAALLIIERLTKVIKSIVTCNNNAVDIAVESKETTQAALDEVKSLKETVSTYKEEFANLLAEVRLSDAEKKKYAEALSNNESFLKTAKLANMEFANELAELLVLANIPNSKKEELYARHRAAIAAIDTADNKNAEVKEDVREEA